ncbi:helix-turn-helix transcriptional regulator [Bradyrhizobium sp.]|jgi:predicted transcriptional regulator YheO|uniref:helix-turn-helix transcriptional regulator n=1 Tax=Bradyrhizobium sp. TaxID=376 RepID=UPI002BA7178B|nr:PAS domain-containing protein [Bradyrhizobium sp.]HWX57233.1 PAS domain-containing protein [Bradyrhizobium sp.]
MSRKRSAPTSPTKPAAREILFDQLKQIAQGLGETFAPFCEVVLHDLTDPNNAIVAIHNDLSGRKVGQPATELGLARIADPNHAQVISNYANTFADGRQAKSTSVGIKDASGEYVAALCLNVDLTLFQGLQSAIGQFVSVDAQNGPRESLNPASADAIRARIDQFAARRATTPRALSAENRRTLLQELKDAGCMEVRRSSEIIAAHLGISRATVYADAK